MALRRVALLLVLIAVATGTARSTIPALAETLAAIRPGVAPAHPTDSSLTFKLEKFYTGTDSASKEFGAARSDHATIALDIGQCYAKEIGDPMHWSPNVRALLLFELDEHEMHTLSYEAETSASDKQVRTTLPALNPFHVAAISFSDRISRDRLEFRRELEDSRLRSRIYQIVTLLLAAGATIFVSVRSIQQEKSRSSSIIGVLAVVLSAAGAAVSSMNAFEGSQAIALRDQRALSQLQQLHWRIASDVMSRPELCANTKASPSRAMEVVGAWRSRLETILDGAVDSISQPGDLSGGIAAVAADHARKEFVSK